MVKLSDRTIGYISFAVIAIILGAVSFGMWKAHQKSVTTIRVVFDELGSLQPEDPVSIRGYQVGQIGKITWTGREALVEVHFYEPRIIREGSSFINRSYALMGQRNLEIIPSQEGKIPSPDYLFKGYFEPGVTEALRFIDDFAVQIEILREVVMLICEGNETRPSFPDIFNQKVSEIETTLGYLESLFMKSKFPISALLEEIQKTTLAVHEISDIADSSVFEIVETALQKIGQANEVLASFSEKAIAGMKLIDNIESHPVVKDILETDETIRKLDSLMAQMNDIIQKINTNGLDFYDENGKKIKLLRWKRIHLIGENARDKAKKRQNVNLSP